MGGSEWEGGPPHFLRFEGPFSWWRKPEQRPLHGNNLRGTSADQGGGGDLIKKTDKCKPEVMHSTVRHKCIFILYAKPGPGGGGVGCLAAVQVPSGHQARNMHIL